MEWFIGLFILYFIWRIFFANTSQKAVIDRDIHRAYLAEQTGQIGIKSELAYTRYKEYAIDRGAEERHENGKTSIGVEKKINEIRHRIDFYLRPNGKANVLVNNIESVENELKERFGLDI